MNYDGYIHKLFFEIKCFDGYMNRSVRKGKHFACRFSPDIEKEVCRGGRGLRSTKTSSHGNLTLASRSMRRYFPFASCVLPFSSLFFSPLSLSSLLSTWHHTEVLISIYFHLFQWRIDRIKKWNTNRRTVSTGT